MLLPGIRIINLQHMKNKINWNTSQFFQDIIFLKILLICKLINGLDKGSLYGLL